MCPIWATVVSWMIYRCSLAWTTKVRPTKSMKPGPLSIADSGVHRTTKQQLVFTAFQNVHNVFGAPPIRIPNIFHFYVSVAANNSRGPASISISAAHRSMRAQSQPVHYRTMVIRSC